MKKSGYRYDIAMLRLISIIVIVFFHAYGMTYVHFTEEVNKMYSDLYEAFNQSYLINIAMPLFVVISGYLFGGQLIRNRYQHIGEVFKAKFKRIMMPFFVFTFIFMVTTNSLSVKPFYQWTYWHLWFLPMLFWCFILVFLFKKILLSRHLFLNILIVGTLFFIACFDRFIPMILGFHNISLWLCWFVLGVKMCQYEDVLFTVIKRYHLIWVLLCGYFTLSTCFYSEYGTNDSISLLTTFLAIVSIAYVFHEIKWNSIKCLPFLMTLSSYSFGIYIFHNWIEMYMVSTTAKRLLHVDIFASEHEYVFPVLFSIIAFFLSCLLTKFTLKSKIGRSLIG